MASVVDVIIIVPQDEEYTAVKQVFSVPPRATTKELPHGGFYVMSKINAAYSRQPVRIAIACVNSMYNYPCLALTERLLFHIKPKLAFLVGSACGNLIKVKPLDVVVTTNAIAYLGRGRRQGEAINPRPYTEPIEQTMKDAITSYTIDQADDFNAWNRRCRHLLKQICKRYPLPEDFGPKSVFKIKSGMIASDDIVLSWSDKVEARNSWSKYVLEEARAYDMESAGFSHACARRTIQPLWAVIRGISDHGIDGVEKYHPAAATIAAEWLRGFLTEGVGRLLDGRRAKRKITKTQIRINKRDLRQLYSLLKEEESRNNFVGKGRFIRTALRSDPKAIQTLEYAIRHGGIKEYQRPNRKTGRPTNIIGLDIRSSLW